MDIWTAIVICCGLVCITVVVCTSIGASKYKNVTSVTHNHYGYTAEDPVE